MVGGGQVPPPTPFVMTHKNKWLKRTTAYPIDYET